MLPVSILFLALLQGLLLQRATAQGSDLNHTGLQSRLTNLLLEVSCSDWLSSNGWSTASEVPWRVQAVCISHLDKLPITVTDTSYRVVATRYALDLDITQWATDSLVKDYHNSFVQHQNQFL